MADHDEDPKAHDEKAEGEADPAEHADDEHADVETVWLRGEGGSVFEHELPLPDDIAKRVRQSLILVVNEDGSPYVPSEDDPELDLESEGDRHARERAAGLEYARLKHEHPEADPLELRDEAADTAGDVIPEDAPQVDDKPKAADSKAVWVHYAKSHGVSDEDANALTKAQLVEKFG